MQIRQIVPTLLLLMGATAGVAAAAGKPGYPDKITWGGRTWQVKSSVQPYSRAGHLHRLTQPSAAAPTVHRFTWRSGTVGFASADLGTWNHDWTYVGTDVPKPGGENVRLNLWLFGGAAPTDGQEVEVVVQSFGFTP